MISSILQIILIFAVMITVDWKEIKLANKRSKALFFLILALSGGIWVYLSLILHPARSGNFLGRLSF